MNFKEFIKESKETSTIEVSVDYFEDGEHETSIRYLQQKYSKRNWT